MQSKPTVAQTPISGICRPPDLRNFGLRLVLWFCAIFLLVLFGGTAPVLANAPKAEQPNVPAVPDGKAVLILSGSQYGIPVTATMATHTIEALRERGVSFKNIYVEMLDLVRNDTPQWRKVLVNALREKLANVNIGLVITQNQVALEFFAQDGYDLVPPHVPVLSTQISNPSISWRGPPHPVLNISSRWDIAATISYGLDLFPRTRRLVVVAGADKQQAAFHQLTHAALATRPEMFVLEDTAALSYAAMLQRIASLPADSLVLLGTYYKDAAGRSFVPAEVAADVARHTNAPVMALYDAHVRQGLVGGSVVITSGVGRRVGEIGFELLTGLRKLDADNADASFASQPMFDWEQVLRWGGDPAILPAHSIFINRPRTVWSEYRSSVIAALAAIALLSALAIALAIQNRKRRLAEEATAALNDQLEEQVASRSAELSARTAVLQTIFDCASSGIAMIADRKFIYGNSRLHEMFGWPQGEMIGKSVEIWYTNQDAYIEAGKIPYDKIWDGEIHCRDDLPPKNWSA